ncbi:MAG: hypothetical protein Q8R45_05870 [Brevundimonas sp.]|uniref:hypothetical protein n=1 Tax=Brevundimonas sp. TaxID=1871086 RepID=UPI002734ED28|nr:hypothetical protein [Brevundimonas sp.]MDP3656476.1 hypothetical protein [Brevundimonas sp.]
MPAATFSPLDQIGIGGHKPPLLLDRLCIPRVFGMQTRFAGTTSDLFFAVTQDFNGLRGSLRGPIVFADVRTLKTLAV